METMHGKRNRALQATAETQGWILNRKVVSFLAIGTKMSPFYAHILLPLIVLFNLFNRDYIDGECYVMFYHQWQMYGCTLWFVYIHYAITLQRNTNYLIEFLLSGFRGMFAGSKPLDQMCYRILSACFSKRNR